MTACMAVLRFLVPTKRGDLEGNDLVICTISRDYCGSAVSNARILWNYGIMRLPSSNFEDQYSLDSQLLACWSHKPAISFPIPTSQADEIASRLL